MNMLLIGMLVCLLGMFMPANAGTLERVPGHAHWNHESNKAIIPVLNRTGDAGILEKDQVHSSKSQVQVRFEKKRKIKFLIRHLQHQPAARKVIVRDSFELPSADDPDHEPMPDEIWHTRPRYYIFLFRLCPF